MTDNSDIVIDPKMRLRQHERNVIAIRLSWDSYHTALRKSLNSSDAKEVVDRIYSGIWGDTLEESLANLEIARKLPERLFKIATGINIYFLVQHERDGNVKWTTTYEQISFKDADGNPEMRIIPGANKYLCGVRQNKNAPNFQHQSDAHIVPEIVDEALHYLETAKRLEASRVVLENQIRNSLLSISTIAKLRSEFKEAFDIWLDVSPQRWKEKSESTALTYATPGQIRKLMEEFPEGMAA